VLIPNIGEGGVTTATLAAPNFQTPNPTPQNTPRVPPLSIIGPSPKYTVPRTPDGPRHPAADWDNGNADLAEAGIGGGHDAPNWSRTKSSMILLGATILYAIIAGIISFT
jgi:Ca2+:H+ antiporter